MANLCIAPPNPGVVHAAPLTQGVLIYLVPFDTIKVIGVVEQYRSTGTGGGDSGTKSYGFVA